MFETTNQDMIISDNHIWVCLKIRDLLREIWPEKPENMMINHWIVGHKKGTPFSNKHWMLPATSTRFLVDVGWCWLMLVDVGWCWLMYQSLYSIKHLPTISEMLHRKTICHGLCLPKSHSTIQPIQPPFNQLPCGHALVSASRVGQSLVFF